MGAGMGISAKTDAARPQGTEPAAAQSDSVSRQQLAAAAANIAAPAKAEPAPPQAEIPSGGLSPAKSEIDSVAVSAAAQNIAEAAAAPAAMPPFQAEIEAVPAQIAPYSPAFAANGPSNMAAESAPANSPAAAAASPPLLACAWQRVWLRQLRLTHYRNYAALKQEFSGAPVVLTGPNGAGKTNLLEAVSLLSPGRGLRRAAYADIPSLAPAAGNIAAAPAADKAAAAGAAENFAVAALLESELYGAVQIGTGLNAPRGSAAGEAGKAVSSRRIQINGAAGPAEGLAEYCRVVWLVPAQDGLFIGPAAERRRFWDRMVLALDAAHGRRVIDYEKIMRSRNRLLAEERPDAGYLAAIEAQMAALGAAIAAARLELAARLNAIAAPLFGAGSFPQAALQAEGLLENSLAESWPAVEAEEDFACRLRDNREADRRAGRSLLGPHRSDLLVWHKEKNMPAALCSTGEQKALLTGIILAHAYLTAELSGMTPILLLDEIAAHLDAQRRAALFALLEELRAQAFMTGTDAALFAALQGRAQFFAVENGRIKPQN